LLWATRSFGESNIFPMYMSARTVADLVTTSYSITARGCWQAAMMLPLGESPSPLQPTLRRKTSHVPPSVYLTMSPPIAWPTGKFEKKNACWLGIQVGPSLYV
jgi:hypothetical protein